MLLITVYVVILIKMRAMDIKIMKCCTLITGIRLRAVHIRDGPERRVGHVGFCK
jgi:hypothetical protein